MELWNDLIGLLMYSLDYLYRLLGSYGLAIIAFTFAIRIVFLPLSLKQIQSAKAMQQLQPQMQALQKKYGKDRQKLAEETMSLYRAQGVNPAAGCLPMLVQMPIWFALYQALINLSQRLEFAAPFLWIADLGQREPFNIPIQGLGQPGYIAIPFLALFTGASQWVIQKMMTPKVTDPQQQMVNQMMQFMPIMFVFFAFQVPSGLVLYWVASNIFTFFQQYFTTGWGSLRPEPSQGREAPASKSEPGSPESAGPAAGSRGGIRTYVLEPDDEAPAPNPLPPASEKAKERRGRAVKRKKRKK